MNLPDILTEITESPLDELAAASLPELDRLFRELAVVKERARLCETTLQSAMHLRYRECADKLRQRASKSTGTVRFEEAGFVIVSELPKQVEYDQPKLKAAVETLRSWGEDPDNYVGIEIKVSEAKYNAWLPAIRALFEPARTLGIGKPTWKLEPLKVGNGGLR